MKPLLLLAMSALLAAGQPVHVQNLRVQILSTMLADDVGYGEWGFAALVEADGHRILFDTGAHPETVLRNLRELKIDLAGVEDVILSHHHLDHTAGLITLRREYTKLNPRAVAQAHVGKGIFAARSDRGSAKEANPMVATRGEYESMGGKFIEHDQPVQLYPGIWLTGPVPRKYPERNWSGSRQLRLAGGRLDEDNLPEDQSLLIDTDRGLVVISGCGHAGVVNTLEYARAKVRNAPVYAAIGGFHLFAASDANLDWTGAKLKEFGVRNLVGAHCTGIESLYRLRNSLGLTRQTAVVGAVGAGFDLAKGIEPGSIAK